MTAQRLNGCHNRQPFRTITPAQDGWYIDGHTRTPRLASMPFRMELSCQYTHSEQGRADAGCTECKWRAPG